VWPNIIYLVLVVGLEVHWLLRPFVHACEISTVKSHTILKEVRKFYSIMLSSAKIK